MVQSYKIGILGLGSIGTRHIQNIVEVLNEQGKTFTIDLFRSGIGKTLSSAISQYIDKIYTSMDVIPSDYDVIFITNPTHVHFDSIKRLVKNTKHMFIEKPVFDKIDVSIASLQLQQNCIYYVACPLRYTKVIQYLKEKCDLSHVFSARVICSSYLPEWRPNQDYRNTYSAHKEQGGGVSIDLIHEWDYLTYLFGLPQKVFHIKGKFSELEIDSEDLAIYIAKYQHMAVEVHLDYFGRKTIREIQIFTDKDTIIGDIANSEIRYLNSGKVISLKEERNDFQRREIFNFFEIVEGRAMNNNDILNALRILQIATEEK